MKYLAGRIVDSVLLACLLCGIKGFQSAETFALIVIMSMVVVCAIGCFMMTEELAIALVDKSSLRKAFGYMVCALYVAVLVITGHPQLAAACFIVFSWLHVAAHSKLKEVSE